MIAPTDALVMRMIQCLVYTVCLCHWVALKAFPLLFNPLIQETSLALSCLYSSESLSPPYLIQHGMTCLCLCVCLQVCVCVHMCVCNCVCVSLPVPISKQASLLHYDDSIIIIIILQLLCRIFPLPWTTSFTIHTSYGSLKNSLGQHDSFDSLSYVWLQ